MTIRECLNKKSLKARLFNLSDKILDHQAKEVLGFSLKTNIDEIDAAEVHAKFIATVIAVPTSENDFPCVQNFNSN